MTGESSFDPAQDDSVAALSFDYARCARFAQDDKGI
jgi:hypothetical protein